MKMEMHISSGQLNHASEVKLLNLKLDITIMTERLQIAFLHALKNTELKISTGLKSLIEINSEWYQQSYITGQIICS